MSELPTLPVGDETEALNRAADLLVETINYVLNAIGTLLPIMVLALLVGAIVGALSMLVVGRRSRERGSDGRGDDIGKAKEPDRPTSAEIFGVSILFALLGMTFGFLSGNSRDPVIGDVLPSIITFITALVGYFISREKTSTIWRKCMPVGLAAMLIAILTGVVIGSQMRRDLEYHNEVREIAFDQYRKFAIDFCYDLAKEKKKELAKTYADPSIPVRRGPDIDKWLCQFPHIDRSGKWVSIDGRPVATSGR